MDIIDSLAYLSLQCPLEARTAFEAIQLVQGPEFNTGVIQRHPHSLSPHPLHRETSRMQNCKVRCLTRLLHISRLTADPSASPTSSARIHANPFTPLVRLPAHRATIRWSLSCHLERALLADGQLLSQSLKQSLGIQTAVKSFAS